MPNGADDLIRMARRHAAVMMGSRTAGDALLAEAFRGQGNLLRRASRRGVLQRLYRALPWQPAAVVDPDFAAVCALPFFNRAVLALTVVEGLSDEDAGDILDLGQAAVRDLRAVSLAALDPGASVAVFAVLQKGLSPLGGR